MSEVSNIGNNTTSTEYNVDICDCSCHDGWNSDYDIDDSDLRCPCVMNTMMSVVMNMFLQCVIVAAATK